MQFNIMHVLRHLCFQHWFSFPVVDGFYLLLTIKLVSKNNCYAVYKLAYACMYAVHTSLARTCLYSGYNYLASAEW